MNEKHEPIHEKQSLNELTNETPDCQELDDDALESTSGGASSDSTCPVCHQGTMVGGLCTKCKFGKSTFKKM